MNTPLMHISHNAPYLPPPPPPKKKKNLRTLCFSFLLGITAVPREIKIMQNFGGQIRWIGRCASGVYWPILTYSTMIRKWESPGGEDGVFVGQPSLLSEIVLTFFWIIIIKNISKTCLLEMLLELLYRYGRGQGFESCTSLNFFQAFFLQLPKLRI